MTTTTLITLSPEDLERRLEAAVARALVRERERIAQPRVLDSADLCRLLGKVYADGRPNLGSLNAFLGRHPTFPRRKVGARLTFERDDVERWLAARKK